jgi:methanogenic corrinoid protein MtbC1
MDAEGIRDTLANANMTLGAAPLMDRVIVPLMLWIGREWHDGKLRVAQEHLASAAVRGFLLALIKEATFDGAAPTIVISTPESQYHEIGALMIALVSALEGWKTVYLGANIPAEELGTAAILCKARAVAISLTYLPDEDAIPAYVEDLKVRVGDRCVVIAGGAAGAPHADALRAAGAHFVADIAEFRTLIQHVGDDAPTG